MITHDSFTLERRIAASPARVFACWADPALKRRWFVGGHGPDWVDADHALDFRVGGSESRSLTMPEGPGAGEHANATHYLDIVPDRRIAFAYTMAWDGRIHSASLATVTVAPDGDGSRLTFTQQAAFFEDSDGVERRRAGWTDLMGALDRVAAERTDG